MADVIYGATGINFAAHGNIAGMASELLHDYESGTWTVTGNSASNPLSVTGEYTKIGRTVTVSAADNDTFEVGGGGHFSLPFTVLNSGINNTACGQFMSMSDSEVGAAYLVPNGSYILWQESPLSNATRGFYILSLTYNVEE
jgi:hypothetical protein